MLGPTQVAILAESSNQFVDTINIFARARNQPNARLASSARDRFVGLLDTLTEIQFSILLTYEFASLRHLLQRPHTYGANGSLSGFELIQTLPATVASDTYTLNINEHSVNIGLKKLFMGFLLMPSYRLRGIISGFAEFALSKEFELYLFSHPKVFDTETDRTIYAEFLICLFRYLTDRLGKDTSGSFIAFVSRFLEVLKTGSIYSVDGYLKEYALAKGCLIQEYMRRVYGSEITDWAADYPRNTIPKIGVLWLDTDKRTENIVGLASCRRLQDMRFEVYSFVMQPSYSGGFASSLKEEIKAMSTEFIEIYDADLIKAANTIRSSCLDLILIMNNITWGFNKYISLCSIRLARRQAVNFCAVITTGFASVDVYFSGQISEMGPSPHLGYTEQLVLLPGSCLIFDPASYSNQLPQKDWDVGSIPSHGTLFASGANFYKLHPKLTETWCEILRCVPDSILILYPFNPNWDTEYPFSVIRRRLEKQLQERGVDLTRIVIAGPWRESAVVTQLLSKVDVYLDSFPHSGGLSSLDALSIGIPVVSKRGETQRENQTADLLRLLGLDEYVASDEKSYVAIAVELASNPNQWAKFHLAVRNSTAKAEFFDEDLYAQKFAAAISSILSDSQSTPMSDRGKKANVGRDVKVKHGTRK